MKKFYEGGECFVLTACSIEAAPLASSQQVGINLAKTLCEDACYLSAEGNGQTALELFRIAGKTPGSPIRHILTIRTHDRSERDCVIRQEALEKGILSLLHQSGYRIRELPFDDYRRQLAQLDTAAVWALKKQEVQEYGVQNTYRSPARVEEVHWEGIYSALAGSGCALCVQIIPALLSENERQRIAKNTAHCSQAVNGVVTNLRDGLAAAAAERWKYYAQNASRPFAEVNLLVLGSVSGSALTAARLKQSVREAALQTLPVPDYGSYTIYNQPWRLARALRSADTGSLDRWTSEETAQIFQLPVQSHFFIGLEGNPFSLIPELELLPEQLTCGSAPGLVLGRSVFSARQVGLPLEQLLLHTAVMGKSGTGKTTLLKQLIAQLQRQGIPVLILEPVKREYRDLIAGLPGSKIFTVERPVTPLLINPFYVPKGVPLGEYRSCLLSAFKAAFSLPDPLPSLFEKAISEAYTLHGWTDSSRSTDPDVTLFDMADFVRVFKRIIARSGYSNEVKGNMMSGGAFRLQSLLDRCPRTFDTIHSTTVEELLSGCAVLEMGNLEPEQKALVSALTLISILAWLKATRKSEHRLKNILLIDEAHALLDQGEGATMEEKALNSTMTQLMINVITEIRAYGVGVIFSDQSPSRVGGRLLDNVDNLLSFRLSGEEAEMLRAHIGADDSLCTVLPLLSAGELLVKNRFLRSPLPVRMNDPAGVSQTASVSDEAIVRAQTGYLAAHAGDYCPFALCKAAGCRCCSVAVREEAKMFAEQLFAQRQHKLRTPEEVAAHLLRLPAALASRISESDKGVFQKLCGCTAVHLLRKCALEGGVSLGQQAAATLLNEMYQQKKEESGNE